MTSCTQLSVSQTLSRLTLKPKQIENTSNYQYEKKHYTHARLKSKHFCCCCKIKAGHNNVNIFSNITFYVQLTEIRSVTACGNHVEKKAVSFCFYCVNDPAENQESLLVEHQTCDWKVASLNPSKSSRRMFSLASVSSPVLLQWHVKDPSHSAKSTAGSLHLNTHTPLTRWSWSGLTMLYRHSVGNYKGKWAHTQLIIKCLAIIASAHWATADWP